MRDPTEVLCCLSEVLLTTCTLRRRLLMPAMSLDVIARVHSPEKSGPLNELGAVIAPLQLGVQ